MVGKFENRITTRMQDLPAAALLLAVGLAGVFVTTFATPVQAHGWSAVHRYVKPTGKCAGQEVLASYYTSGRRTASGEAYNSEGYTAASHDHALGTLLMVTNPKNGRSVSVRINDRGPNGVARRMGAKLDLSRGAFRALGMMHTQYVCI
jgi:rare lipoprotein A